MPPVLPPLWGVHRWYAPMLHTVSCSCDCDCDCDWGCDCDCDCDWESEVL